MGSLPHALKRIASQFPGGEAVHYQRQSLTWAGLWRGTCVLASFLQRNGVERGDRVAIYMNKSLETVIAIYAIMKTGAAYIPLDQSAPIDRLRGIVAESRIRCLITHQKRLKEARHLWDDGNPLAQWEDLDFAVDPTDEEILAGPDDVAYILYTSGSSGVPKGIVHSHASALAFATWAACEYGLTRTDRVSSHAPFHFDLSIFDLFSSVLAGATTVLVPDTLAIFPAAVVRFIREERISVWYSVPYAWIQMLERGHLEETSLDSLRWVLFAGESFPPKYLRRLMAAVPARFSNLYGPTETNVCTWHHVDHPPEDDSHVPIGRPCPGTESVILEGELLIWGPTVMRGYLGRPDLDRDCFLNLAGRRFYRTGDLVSQDPNGVYHYLARKDRQVKVRGYRVELDEVEDALLRHPDVKEASACVKSDGSGSHRIEAVVNTGGDLRVTTEDLKQHAARLLPSYAVPHAIHFFADFPRTSTGKVDRGAIELRLHSGTE